MMPLMGGIAVGSYAYLATRHRLGGYARRELYAVQKYGQQVVTTLKQFLADKFYNVTITREPSVADPSKVIFKFSRVRRIDFAAVDKCLEELNIDDEKSWADQFSALISDESYDVVLTTNGDRLFGEMDFCDWFSTPEIGVEVKKMDGMPLEPGEIEYEAVVNSLKRVAKFSTKYSPLDEVVNFPENTWRNYIGNILGLTSSSISIDLLGGLDEQLLSGKYISQLQQLAIYKATLNDHNRREQNILFNYRSAANS